MKIVISLVVFLVALFAIGNAVYKTVSDRNQDRVLRVAFGVPHRDEIQLHVAVPPMVSERDPPQLNKYFVQLWEDWVEEHFQLVDESGKKIDLSRIGASGLIR